MEFDSLDDLKKRVEPALNSKCNELKRFGYNISKEDIWNSLSKNVFSKSHNLTLYDVVLNIMKFDIKNV